MTCRAGLLALTGIFGCSAGADGPRLAVPEVDTLPGGVVAVHNTGPAGWADTNGWRLIPDGRIGGALGEPGELINPLSIALDDMGRLYVADQQPAVVKLFDSDGSFVRAIGHEGQGPGEFQVAFVAARGEYLAVQDARAARLSLFDSAGTLIRSWYSGCCLWASMAFDEAHRIHVPVTSPRDAHASARYVRYDTLGAVIDTVSVAEGPEVATWTLTLGSGASRMQMMRPVPHTPQMIHAVTPEGELVAGWTGAYKLARTAAGDTLAIYSREWTAEPLTEERRQLTVDRIVAGIGARANEATLRKSLPLGDLPATLPAFIGLDVDGRGNIWVTTDSDSSYTNFDVLGPTGAWLGRVVLPEATPPGTPMAWGADHLFVAREDADGVPYIARYRIERGTDDA